mgnify:CR=1 FL=1
MEYNYPKFTPEMKKTHTILIPNISSLPWASAPRSTTRVSSTPPRPSFTPLSRLSSSSKP